MLSAAQVTQDKRDMCERYNFNALDFTKKKVLAVLPDLQEREAEIDAMIAAINQELVNQLVHFSAQEGIDSLAELIINTLQDNVAITQQNINDWINHYRGLEEAASRKHQQHLRQAAPNIINYLKEGSQLAKTALGDNYDINAILKYVMSHTEGVVTGNATKFESNKDYILPAISLIVSAEEAALLDPIQVVAERLQTIIEQTRRSGENINIYMPANCGQGHWVLIHFTINGPEITDASVTDSMGGNPVANSQVKGICRTVNENRKVKVRRINKKVQTNAHSCMDFTIKHALQAAKTIPLDENLISIRDAANQTALRSAVIKTLYHHHPDLQVIYREHHEHKRAEKLAKSVNNELKSLITDANVLSASHRLAYFRDNCLSFKYGQVDMSPVLACLMPSDQTELVRFVFDTYVNDFDKLQQCLEHLPEEEKFDYLMRKYYVIQTTEQILSLGTLVPAERAQEYWSKIVPFITTAAILKRFLPVVPNQEMRDLLVDAYVKRVVTQQELLELMEALPVGSRDQVLARHPALLKIDANILARLEGKKAENMDKVIAQVTVTSFAELLEMMKDYNTSECLHILEKSLGRQKFADTDNFPAVLRCIAIEKRWLIVKQCDQYITKDNIRAVKKVLEVKDRNALIMKHQNKFASTAEMIAELDAAAQYKHAKSHVGKPDGTDVIAALNPKAKTDITTYSKILFELNRYLTFRVKLHDERVKELQGAVKSAESINDVVDLIQSQIELMRFNGKPNPKFSVRNFSFLNHAPGKKLISIGYKIMLKRCERVLGLKS